MAALVLHAETGLVLGITQRGTLLMMLDRPGELPDELAEKAIRYGWPADASYFPAFIGAGPEGPSDLADVDARRLQVAMAAVLALDARGLVLAEAAPAMTGRVALADGAYADFVVRQDLSRPRSS